MSVWAIAADHIEPTASSAIERRALARVERKQGTASAQWLSDSVMTFATIVGDAAVIPVWGPLMNRRSFFMWSYDEIQSDLALAVAHPDVKRIVLDIDSPGGMVEGCAECGEAIVAASELKPLSSQIKGMGTSAAYWLASAGGPVSATQGSVVGSVGTLIRYMDIEPVFTKMGARIVEVVAKQSPNKRLDPESKDGRAELQAIVDEGCATFLEAVASYRGVSVEDAQKGFGGGLVFTATEALGRGMIDRVGPMQFTAGGGGDDEEREDAEPAAAATADAAEPETQEAILPNDPTGGAVATPTPIPSAEEAVASERTRVAAILDAAGPHASVANECISQGLSLEASLVKILAAERGANASALAEMQAAADTDVEVTPVITNPAPAAPAAAADSPDAWRAEFAASDTLKSEFATADDYAAFRKADADGLTTRN